MTRHEIRCTVPDCGCASEVYAEDWAKADEGFRQFGWHVERDGKTPRHRCPVHARITFLEPEVPSPLQRAAWTQYNVLPEDSSERKAYPMCTGLIDYFPAALAYVAKISKIGNDKHNPGEPLHHARGKSMDHPDCILRHLVDRGRKDADGVRHSGYLAWRALAMLQEELEREEGAPLARGAKL